MKPALLKIIMALAIACSSVNTWSQSNDPFEIQDDDLNIGGDIFTDFNEDVEAKQVLEDERFYRYGRFFSFQLGVGRTTFTGNRGQLYIDELPSYTMALNFFNTFNTSFGIGFAFSKHHFEITDTPVRAFAFEQPPGLVESSMLRVFFSYRYYIDTSDLGTAITWSNPYVIGRLEYWYVTNKFQDLANVENDTGGGLGFAGGFGLEFPIKLKESYINAEFLLHSVDFHDKYTSAFQPVVDDLSGLVSSAFLSYVFSW